jgi:hypothetical protein
MLNYKPAIIIDWYEFVKKINGNIREFIGEIEENRKKLKVASGYVYDNNISRFRNRYDDEFLFYISEKKQRNSISDIFEEINVFEIYVWSIADISVATEILTNENKKEVIEKISDRCNLWSLGKICCCDCGKIAEYEKIKNNTYFAGIYCQECWERKWKKIEAEETYD